MTPRSGEEVLVVPRAEIFATGIWQGLLVEDLEEHHRVLRRASRFQPRDEVEEDPSYQQVIPYLVFRHAGRYLLTRRLGATSERRLRQRYALGVGGHINPEDVRNGDPVGDGMRREWEEEVDYRGRFQASLVGLLKDESSAVSRVHLGLVYLVEGDSDRIAIRETEKLSGELLSLEAMRPLYPEMETWSQIVYDHLAGRPASELLGSAR